MPLGDTAEGSGQCNTGSGVKPSAGAAYCAPGDVPLCVPGSGYATLTCHSGTSGWDWDDV